MELLPDQQLNKLRALSFKDFIKEVYNCSNSPALGWAEFTLHSVGTFGLVPAISYHWYRNRESLYKKFKKASFTS